MREEKDIDYLDMSVFSVETFFIFFFGSLLIGAGWAIFISFVIANISLDDIPWIEIGFFSLACYFPYILCEAIGCSGVLSIFICGMMMRNYAFFSLSMYSEVTIEYMIDTIAFTIENFIFCYLGISIPLIWEDLNLEHFGAGIAALTISRILAVLIISRVIN
jgi:NhaP-type Na+/H+ or K+/H+ antiporter